MKEKLFFPSPNKKSRLQSIWFRNQVMDAGNYNPVSYVKTAFKKRPSVFSSSQESSHPVEAEAEGMKIDASGANSLSGSLAVTSPNSQEVEATQAPLRRSTRRRFRPFEYWSGERPLVGRLDGSAETEELSIKLNEACDALIPLQYQLLDHQFELQFQSESKSILSEMISTSNPPPEDETLTRLHSIMANLDTTILNEEEEIKNFNALINQKNDEVSQVRKKLAVAAGLLNKKHNDMAKIQKDIDDTNSQIRHNQLVVRMAEEMATTLELWLKESLCCRIRE